MYTIDAKTDKDAFIIINNETGNTFKISKRGNSLDTVKRWVGIINIKEIILAEEVTQ